MNNNLIDIIYSETIDRYVIILKRFPDMPVVVYSDNDDVDNDFNKIYDLCGNFPLGVGVQICDPIFYVKDDIFYGIELYKNDTEYRYSNIFYRNIENIAEFNKMRITELEKFEIINKMLELRQILIERGEIDE